MPAPLAGRPGGNVSTLGPTLSSTLKPPGILAAHPVILLAGLGAVGLVGWYLWRKHAKSGRSARRRSSHPLTRRVRRAPSRPARRAGKPIWVG